MKKEDCFFLGYVSRKHGYKGDVNIMLETPAKHKELAHMFIDLNGRLVPFFIDSFRLKKENIALVKFDDIDSEQEAQKLVGKEIYLPLELLDQKQQNELTALIGFDVVDAVHGNIGTVWDIFDNTAQKLFQIKNKEQELLIPITEEFIQKIENNTIFIQTPQGLIDLFLE
tara:strand:+ start:500 stop:1009 length:510 start_codon:yes stop_codon:yes gene_type:complete